MDKRLNLQEYPKLSIKKRRRQQTQHQKLKINKNGRRGKTAVSRNYSI